MMAAGRFAQVRSKREYSMQDILRTDLENRRELIELYKEVETCVQLDPRIREDVFTAFPNFMTQAEKARKELDQKESPLLVIGETSAGKSSFLNMLLGREILPESATPCTSCLCYLRYGDSLKAEVSTLDGETLDIPDITGKDDEDFQTKLEELIACDDEMDMTKRIVNIYVPCDLLKGSDVFLVDTPGIDDKDVVKDLLMKYLTSAVGVVFLINPTVNFGLADDRGPAVLEIIKTMIANNELQSFDPKKMLFIVNKWDQIKKSKDKTKIADTIERKLVTRFPEWFHGGVNIRYISVWEILEVTKKEKISPKSTNRSDEHQKVLTAMGDLIRVCSQARMMHHTGIMKKLVNHFQESLMMIEAYERQPNWETKEKKLALCNKILQELEDLFEDSEQKITEEMETLTKSIAKEAHEYIHNPENRDQIFLWKDHHLKGNDLGEIERDYKAIIKRSIHLIIAKHTNRIKEMNKNFQAHLQKIEEKQKMFRAVFIDQPVEHETKGKSKENSLSPLDIVILAVTSPLWIPVGLVLFAVKTVNNIVNRHAVLAELKKAVLEGVSMEFVKMEVERKISGKILEDIQKMHHCVSSYRVRIRNLDQTETNAITQAAFRKMENLANELNVRLERLE